MSEVSEGTLWRAMEDLYDQGLSVLWCRMEMEIVNGHERKAKTPIGVWRSATKTRFTKEHLSKIMHAAQVKLGITVVCGQISGNLEVIDIDVKHWPGIDALYFQELKDIFPALFERLRITQSPSGGKHIPYFCEEPINEGGKKLACLVDPTTGKPGEAGIETRGEGSLCTWVPSPGYTVFQDRPIPTLTRAERDALITLAKLFDQRVKKVFAPKTKAYNDMYDENPFEHYNKSTEAEQILLKHGWTVMQDSKQYIYFTHPEKKSRGNSATFLKAKRLYRIWTTSIGQLESGTNYSPANVLCQLEFGGDWKATYRHLTSHGYGKVRPDYEQKMLPKLAASRAPVPKNFSQAAKEDYQTRIKDHHKRFPHGVFWELNDDDEYTIRRPQIIDVCAGLGLAVYNDSPIQIRKPFFWRLQSEREAYDLLLTYIQEDDEDTYMRIVHAFDKFWERSGKYILTRLPIIDSDQILKSSFETCYRVFRRKIVAIKKDGIRVSALFDSYEKLVDRDTVIDREWNPVKDPRGCKFVDFLNKAIGLKGKDLQKVLGYLAYDYKDETEGYIVASQEMPGTKEGGGTGKGLVCQFLGLFTTVKTIDGDMIARKDLLLQSWNGERVLHLNDLPKKTNLAVLKALSTEGGEQKILYKNIRTIRPGDMPKLFLSGQFGLNLFDDGGVKRRMVVLPFTGYFNSERTPIIEYGGKLPDVWTKEDWDGYYTYMVHAVWVYMQDRRIDIAGKEKESVWEKNWDYTYGMGSPEHRYWVGDNVVEKWQHRKYITSEDLQQEYDKFCREQNIKNDMRIGRLHEAIQEWCKRHGFEYQYSKLIKIDGTPTRVSIVTKAGDKPKVVEEPGGDLFDKAGYPADWDSPQVIDETTGMPAEEETPMEFGEIEEVGTEDGVEGMESVEDEGFEESIGAELGEEMEKTEEVDETGMDDEDDWSVESPDTEGFKGGDDWDFEL